jgi:hypothetical protein
MDEQPQHSTNKPKKRTAEGRKADWPPRTFARKPCGA